jgi:hypothetical protein
VINDLRNGHDAILIAPGTAGSREASVQDGLVTAALRD